MNWYNLDEKNRIKEYYSKYSIKNFWDWWANGENRVMEVRIKDWQLIKQVAAKFKLPYSLSGVYVFDSTQLKNVIANTRDIATTWFGVQPRKVNYNKKGWKSFGGLDTNVSEIAFLFLDVDRVMTGTVATNKELENCNILMDKIIDKFSKQNWFNGYVKICSGYGLQVLIKLDFPIKMPEVIFENTSKDFLYDEKFEKIKCLFREGIGKQIKTFADKYKAELGVSLDKSCFTIGRVGALPTTKNHKYNTFAWRGILEMKDKTNDGLSDYVLEFINNIKEFKKNNIFSKSRANYREDRVKSVAELCKHPIVLFMLNNKLPAGDRNNSLWLSIKILIRDNKIDMNTKEFRELHKELEKVYCGSLTLNLPDKKYVYNKNTINNFCIKNCLPLVYPIWENKTKKLNMKLENISWEIKEYSDKEIELKNDTNIMDDMIEFKKTLIENSYDNIIILANFTKGCIRKYGEQTAKYYFDTLFYKFFSYD